MSFIGGILVGILGLMITVFVIACIVVVVALTRRYPNDARDAWRAAKREIKDRVR